MPDWVEPAASGVAAVVAMIAVAVAWLARRDSKRSAGAAERSAISSEDSAKSSADSAAVAQREEARGIERADVEWQRIVERPARQEHVEFRNVGTTTAYVVTAVVTINGERIHLQQDQVQPAANLTYDATGLGKRVVIGGTIGGSRGGSFVYGTRFDLQARITWQSKLGTPEVWTYDSSTAKTAGGRT